MLGLATSAAFVLVDARQIDRTSQDDPYEVRLTEFMRMRVVDAKVIRKLNAMKIHQLPMPNFLPHSDDSMV